MARHELTDAEWDAIADLFPSNEGNPGRPWNDHRTMMNAMVWILRTGAPWRDLPEKYGPWQSVYDRFSRYESDGTWDMILRRLQRRLAVEGHIDKDRWYIDGSSIRASRAAAGAKKKPARGARRPRSGTVSRRLGHQAALGV